MSSPTTAPSSPVTVGLFADLRGKSAIVTGGFSGIGFAVAEELARQGVNVHAVGLPGNRVPSGTTPLHVDLTDEKQLDQLLKRVPSIDFLVNAAGTFNPEPLGSVKRGTWDATFDVNAKALFFITQHYVSTMKAGSAVVNLASVAGKSAKVVNGIAYNASKASVIAMTKTLAYALADNGIRVNAVCPGVTDTPMLDGIFSKDNPQEYDRMLTQYLQDVPLGRIADPREIASVIIFLLSSASSYMTGQAINVSGGLVMW